MLSVRNITGYAVAAVDVAPKANVRHVTGYAFYSKSRFDRTILGRTNLLNVIASECLGVLADIATVGTSIAANEVGKKNTKVLIASKAGSGYRSEFYMYYNRTQIDRYFLDVSWKLTVSVNTTLFTLLPAINTAYGCKLDESDVVDVPVAKDATTILLTASATSSLCLPGSTVRIGSLPTLASVVKVTDLSGFDGVTA